MLYNGAEILENLKLKLFVVVKVFCMLKKIFLHFFKDIFESENINLI